MSHIKPEDFFKNIISHSKEYGFIFQSSEIYDGLSAVYDYGQMGVELKKNIRDYWWKSMVQMHENIVGIDTAIFMHPTTWKASGHIDAFNDPLIDNKESKKRYRADVLIEEHVSKFEDKIKKEIEKAAGRFENFDRTLFRSTNGRVKEYQEKIDIINARFKTALNNSILSIQNYTPPQIIINKNKKALLVGINYTGNFEFPKKQFFWASQAN
jgi:glycyl-tRNA synthetase